MKIRTIYDRTELIDHTVRTVGENLLVGAALVIAILIIFLGNWRAALIVATVIPLSLLFAFIMLDARGIPANLISLGAVDIGIIIDSAVVLVEALMVRLAIHDQQAASGLMPYAWRKRTLKQTVVELGHPILFAKTIIIVAFIPVYTFQRVEGKIFSPVAFTLSFAMLGAIFLTMALAPTLLAWTITRHPLHEKHSVWMVRITAGYRRLLIAAQQGRMPVMVGAGALLVLTLAFAPLPGSEFLPKLEFHFSCGSNPFAPVTPKSPFLNHARSSQ